MALIVAVAALIAAIAAAVISFRQLSEVEKANAFPATIDLFREYRAPEMVAARRLISDEFPGLDAAQGFRGQADDAAQAALKVSHFLDNLGVLVANGLVDPKLAAGFLGDSTLRLWTLLAPFIARERELRSPNAYLQYFEHLAVTLHDIQPVRVRAELKTWAGPSSDDY